MLGRPLKGMGLNRSIRGELRWRATSPHPPTPTPAPPQPHGSLSPANPIIHHCQQPVSRDPGVCLQHIEKCASLSSNTLFAMLTFPQNQIANNFIFTPLAVTAEPKAPLSNCGRSKVVLHKAPHFQGAAASSRSPAVLAVVDSVAVVYRNFRTISHNFFPQLLTLRLKQRMRLIYGFFSIRGASHPRLFLASFQLAPKRGAAIRTCLCSVLFISKVSQKFVSIFKHSVE